MSQRQKIAIFQANWPLQVHTTNPIRELTAHGYDVDIFLFNVPQYLDSLTDLPHQTLEHLHIFDFTESHQSLHKDINKQLLDGVKTAIKNHGWLYKSAKKIRDGIKKWMPFMNREEDAYQYPSLPGSLLEDTLKHINGNSYKCLIGIEVYGFVWAGLMADSYSIPLVYWSLELYTYNNPYVTINKGYQQLKKLESKYHQKADATIIQDRQRANILLADNKVDNTHILEVPVSLLGRASSKKSSYLHQKLNIPPNNKVILNFGMITRYRLAPELVQISQDFPEDWTLVFHGEVYMDITVAELEKLNIRKRAIFSTEIGSITEIDELIASATIGLVFYPRLSANYLLTGKSSEKIARCALSGIPMIAFDFPSIKNIFDEYHCGRCVENLSEVNREIEHILADYRRYQSGALRAYNEIYEFSNQFSKVIDWIGKY